MVPQWGHPHWGAPYWPSPWGRSWISENQHAHGARVDCLACGSAQAGWQWVALMTDFALAHGTLMEQNNLSAEEQLTRDRQVIAILDHEIPLWPVYEELARLGQSRANSDAPDLLPVRRVMERRQVLEGLPAEDLAAIHSRLTAQRAQKEESERFYNQPGAYADFKHWLSMDFWSLDDSVSLLLGRNPEVVNKTTVALFLDKPKGLFAGAAKPPTKFTNAFQALQRLAERSNAMTASPRLSPLEVARWGATVLGGALPAPLADLLKTESETLAALPSVPVTVSVSERASDTGAEVVPITLTREELVAKYLPVWPSIESNLKNAQRNGLAACAKSGIHGRWIEARAVEWAKENRKLVDPPAVRAHSAHRPFNP